MCRGLGIDDNLDINTWSAMHALAPVLFVNIARLGVSIWTKGAFAPSIWDLVAMHATVLHEFNTAHGNQYPADQAAAARPQDARA